MEKGFEGASIRTIGGNAGMTGAGIYRHCKDKEDLLGLYVFDTAQDYGMGKCQPMLGRLAGNEMLISAKYTPLKKYKKGSVIESLEKDLKELKRDYVDIYWLHL